MSSTRKWVNRKGEKEIVGESWKRFESGDREKERERETEKERQTEKERKKERKKKFLKTLGYE
jgi:hypothetical protein